MPAHQVLPLTAYTFEASNSMSETQANKIYSMDQSELSDQWNLNDISTRIGQNITNITTISWRTRPRSNIFR